MAPKVRVETKVSPRQRKVSWKGERIGTDSINVCQHDVEPPVVQSPVLEWPVVELIVETHYWAGVPPAAPCWVVWATWKYNQDMDSEYDKRQWDFLVLHPADGSPDLYISSLYMMSADTGKVWFVTPPGGGEFSVSAVRDHATVALVIKKKEGEGPRYKEYTERLKTHRAKLLTLGSATFTAPSYELCDLGRQVPPGSTAATEIKEEAVAESSSNYATKPAAGKLRHTHSWHTQRDLVIATAEDDVATRGLEISCQGKGALIGGGVHLLGSGGP